MTMTIIKSIEWLTKKLKDPNATITLTAMYALTDEAHALEELRTRGSVVAIGKRKTQCIQVELNAKEALRTGYITDDPKYNSHVLCPSDAILSKLKPDLDKVGVLRESLPKFNRVLSRDEAATFVMREMYRYDEVLALSKAENEKKQKPKPSENPPHVTLVGRYLLTPETLRMAHVLYPEIGQEQTVLISVDAKEALRTGYINEKNEYDDFVLCKLEPDLETDIRVLRGPKIPEFDHILSEEEATKIVTDEMGRYAELLSASVDASIARRNEYRANEKKLIGESRENSQDLSSYSTIIVTGKYMLTNAALKELSAIDPTVIKIQTITVEIDAEEAFRTEYIKDSPDVRKLIANHQEYEKVYFLFSEVNPCLERVGVSWSVGKIPEFSCILTKEEATSIIKREMEKYDEAIAISKAVRETRERKERSCKERPVVELCANYRLTDEAHTAALAVDFRTTLTQKIDFNIDAEEAIRTEYATLDGKFSRGDEDSTFSKLEPDLDREGVLRRSSRNEFDHVLTASEAATIVTAEMKRCNEVLGVSQKIQELKAKNQSTAVVLVGAYLLTKKAHENLALSGIQTTRKQRVPVVLDAKEAVRTKYATINKNGCIVSLRPEDVLFQKIEPYPPYYYDDETLIPEFDHILTVEEASKIVTDEMTRFDEVLAASKAEGEALAKEREENWGKERATSKALEEERQKSKNAFLAELRCYMPRIVDGDPCVIDSNERGMPAWLEMDGKRIDVRYDLLDSQECEAVKKTLLGEWRKRSDAEITSWIQEHGSPRLKKAVGAGLLSQIRGAYRSERLEIELPEWMFLSEEEQDHIKERLNPSEDEIDAFVEAKKKWPEGNVRLSSVRVLFKAPAFEGWASFLVMKCPFHNALIGRICLHSNENDVTETETSSKPENPKNPSDEIEEDPLEK